MFIQAIILGTALPPWNRGRPVQEVLARRVPPCPDIRGFRAVPVCSHSLSHPVLQRRGHHAGRHQRWLDDLGHRGDALVERRHAEDQDSGGNLYRQQIHGHAEVSFKTKSGHHTLNHTISCLKLIPNIFSILKLFDTELQVISRQHVIAKKHL